MTANNGRGELVMKNWKKCIGGERTPKTLASALAMSFVALEISSAATPATPHGQADPMEKGATWLKCQPPPERLPSETNNPVLAPLVDRWKGLLPELRHYPTMRSNHTVS